MSDKEIKYRNVIDLFDKDSIEENAEHLVDALLRISIEINLIKDRAQTKEELTCLVIATSILEDIKTSESIGKRTNKPISQVLLEQNTKEISLFKKFIIRIVLSFNKNFLKWKQGN